MGGGGSELREPYNFRHGKLTRKKKPKHSWTPLACPFCQNFKSLHYVWTCAERAKHSPPQRPLCATWRPGRAEREKESARGMMSTARSLFFFFFFTFCFETPVGASAEERVKHTFPWFEVQQLQFFENNIDFNYEPKYFFCRELDLTCHLIFCSQPHVSQSIKQHRISWKSDSVREREERPGNYQQTTE